ncbi:hypothetical protein JZU68_05385, partial [bacterium]|nr:hypothetical protein [bacterium]
MKFAEDWEMWIRVVSFFPAATLEEPLVYMRKHSDSLAGSAVKQNYNYNIWKKIIISNRKQIPEMGIVNYCKAMSFYFLNLSHT